MLATLHEARTSALRNIAGACPMSDAFLQLVNDATRRLMRRGDWPGTTVPIHVCVQSSCLVWPRYVGSVRAMNICNQPIPIKNGWYDFLPYTGHNWGVHVGSNWWGSNSWGDWCGASTTAVMQGKSPVFQDMLGEGRLVRAYATARIDLGKTITLFGTDNNGQTLRHRNADDTWDDGWILTLTTPFASTTDFVRHIDRVLLDDMESDVRIYGYNATTDLLEDIATYEPGDTNPAFERFRVNFGGCSSSGGGCSRSVVALVKLRYVPARVDNDLVLIDNLDALKLMMSCIKLEEAGDRKGARECEQDSIREMNLGLMDESPLSSIPISDSTFEGTNIGRMQVF